ncbi:MAG: hypothetical protein BGP06_04345 [Rhizobiales bacterium 65-9]|nr:mechanosensitive ion channel family protein [Hyphomicrobiales bacterium]OJY32433.1 MAG: hypothetical protein BGP06_04345 [Rhizobiales bacterium 65-9]
MAIGKVRVGVLAVVLGVLAVATAYAQGSPPSPPQPPAGLSQEQFNAIVSAASEAARAKLAQPAAPAPAASTAPSGVPAAAAPAEAPAASPMMMDDGMMEKGAGMLVDRLGDSLSATPEFLTEAARIPHILMTQGPGRSLSAFLLLLAFSIAAALTVESLLRRTMAGVRARLAAGMQAPAPLHGLRSFLGLLALDAIGLLAVFLVSYGAVGLWFQGSDAQAQFARLALTGIFAWRLYMVAFRATLRPERVSARIAPLGDGDARAIYRSISVIILAGVALRTVVVAVGAIGASPPAMAGGIMFARTIIFALMFQAMFQFRQPIADWFARLGRPGARASIAGFLGPRWLAIAVPFFAILYLAEIYGAAMNQPMIASAMLKTLNLALALLFLETLGAFLIRRQAIASPDVDAGAPARRRTMSSVVMRSLRVAALIIVAAMIVQLWVVDVFQIIDASGWRAATRASITAGGAALAGFVLWEIIAFVTERYIVHAAPPGAALADDDAIKPAASRLATLAPLIRVAAAIVITIVASLVVLTELGVNVTPIIAGASVFGLAVSFGSQTLVKDIVSGMFYLADDAFRVGEYIDCGKAKGTVEGFTLRSIKLRHQNGQVHTIPFGQLGQITNFSRDWATVKFNLRIARGADLEKVRKAVKKVGIAMLEDPETKDEFLAPVKLQGIADIQDNALVVRVKFTVKPQNPSMIQRVAVRKIMEAFVANGIEFASPTVAVQTIGGERDAVAAAASGAAAAAHAQAIQIANTA